MPTATSPTVRRAACTTIAALCATAYGQDTLPATTLAALKDATVYIRVALPKGAGSGSGFVVKTSGDVAHIVTNRHVVLPEGADPAKVRHQVVFHPGTPKEQPVEAQLVAVEPKRDLAVLRVAGAKDLPKPLEVNKRVTVSETMNVFILGFPFGQSLATTKGAPSVTVNKGSVSSVRLDEAGKPAVVQIDGSINPGNSGGPILDRTGGLVGVSVATIKGAGIGLAIPREHVLDMLAGRVLGARFEPKGVAKGQAEIGVEAVLIDPLAKIRSVTMLYVPADAVKEPIRPGKDGAWPRLPGARTLTLAVKEQLAAGSIKVPAADKTATPDLVVQFGHVGSDGRTVYTAPWLRKF
jgi:S1-C subfamily serine protease